MQCQFWLPSYPAADKIYPCTNDATRTVRRTYTYTDISWTEDECMCRHHAQQTSLTHEFVASLGRAYNGRQTRTTVTILPLESPDDRTQEGTER
jgi:hypothetical protein